MATPWRWNWQEIGIARHGICSILFVSLLFSPICVAQDEQDAEIPDAVPAIIQDPSLIPAPKDEFLHGERIRLLADFNGDGRGDLALSDDTASFTNAGILFTLYLTDHRGKYARKMGDFSAHPKAIAIEKTGDDVYLWTYSRGGRSVGHIGYYKTSQVAELKYESIEIRPGWGDGDVGTAIYGAVFSNSDIPIRAERSTTLDGVVMWNALYDDDAEAGETASGSTDAKG